MRRLVWRIAGAFLVLSLAGIFGVPAALAAQGDGGEKVNINTAEVDVLSQLPGIGPAYAQRIVDYRKEFGPFKTIEDLLNVRGIGDRTFEKIRDLITVKAK
jgi:competence ComEA-like helix-hairpin-helix protein